MNTGDMITAEFLIMYGFVALLGVGQGIFSLREYVRNFRRRKRLTRMIKNDNNIKTMKGGLR